MENDDVEDGRWLESGNCSGWALLWGCAGLAIVMLVLVVIGIIKLCSS